MNGYFIDIEGLHMDGTPFAAPAGIHNSLGPWLPGRLDTLAVLHNYAPGGDSFDYILLTDKLACFAIFLVEDGGCSLRSVKLFKQNEVNAMALCWTPARASRTRPIHSCALCCATGKR